MSMDAERIEAESLVIADAHGCHTVVLYGSRARGDADAGSDVDLLCIRAAGPTLRDARTVGGVYFDAFVYAPDALAAPDVALLRIIGGRVLRERAGEGTALLERVRAQFDAGPTPIAEDDRTMRIVWAHKMLDRVRRDEGVGGDYRRMQLVVQALEDYFALRTLWYQGPKMAFPWLRGHDEGAYRAFEEAARGDAGDEALGALVRAVYGATPER
ncbi:MAG TPA: nucleotidyltransferase domain-containing protein [Polyangia bacterium]|jgi:predicted nucleotidyltransferase